jgi:putative ABC transport system substrate-binding protein
MRRRSFLAWAGGGAVAWLAPAAAQQARTARIGVLLLGGPEPFLKHFRDGMAALGYGEGRNLELVLRAANSDAARLPAMAVEIAAAKPDVIVASETPAVQAAKNAAPATPIVMAASGDPVGTGLIASLARPGGTITGLSAQAAELAGKSLELMRELLPGLKRAAVIALERNPLTKPFFEHAQRAAGTLGLELATLTVPNAAALGDAFAKLAEAKSEALVVQPSLPLKAVAELCLARRLPAVSITRAFADAGGLMSYAASLVERYRGAADYVDKILKAPSPPIFPSASRPSSSWC